MRPAESATPGDLPEVQQTLRRGPAGPARIFPSSKNKFFSLSSRFHFFHRRNEGPGGQQLGDGGRSNKSETRRKYLLRRPAPRPPPLGYVYKYARYEGLGLTYTRYVPELHTPKRPTALGEFFPKGE